MEDHLVWLNLQHGNADAVDALMKKYYADLYNYGLKLSANPSLTKDCIQDLFLKLWRERETLSPVTFVKTYLLKSLKHSLLHGMTRDARWSHYPEGAYPEAGIVFSQEDLLIGQQELSEQREKVVQALNTLPRRHREAVYLKFYGELSNEQIAEIMALKTQSVYNLIYEALKILKGNLLFALCTTVLWWQ
jgi:RNA polymerase sigma factor (sigma-70 family)